MEEELEFSIRTWDFLEREYLRSRTELAQRLAKLGRPDLRDRVNLATYGTTQRGEVMMIRRRQNA
jgi:hypothetical protein